MRATYVQLLGGARAQLGRAWLEFAPDKRYRLLAYLAYAGDWVSRDELSYLFWPDTSTAAARQSLRQLLKRVRQLDWLAEAGLEAEAQRLRWRVRTDVLAFRKASEQGRLDEALSLYGGPLLSGLDSYEESEFAGWLDLEREHLHGSWRDTVLRRAHELEALGRHHEAAGLLGTLLKRDELDEEALRAYMAAALRAGERESALRSYRSFARRLRDDLAVEPTSATVRLAEAIQEDEPAFEELGPGGAAPSSPPGAASAFVGREVELAEVAYLLSRADCRLLTLTGPGGVGKSRLALQAAHELSRRDPDGVRFVSLEALASPDLIPTAIAGALNLELRGKDESLAQVSRAIGQKRLLLVLDNFEHLLEGATLIAELLRRCPKLELLITSRERLNLKDEWLLAIEGLPYPTEDAMALEEALSFDAVRLFVLRVQRIDSRFSPTEEDLPHLLKICRLAGGLPLALELAAVWARALTLADIAEEIERNLDVLATPARDADARHRSLRAVFEHSWERLAPKEQEVFSKLAVFRGGFRREAAAYVVGASVAVLAALVDKSLLRLFPGGRYDRHPLLYRYAQEKLAAHREGEAETRERHAGYFLAVAEEAEPQLTGGRQAVWLARLEEEHDNLRAVLEWAEASGKAELSLRLAGALWRFWLVRGYPGEGRAWLAKALSQAQAAGTVAYAKGLYGAGVLAVMQGDYAAARAILEESLAVHRQLEIKPGVAWSLYYLGRMAGVRGDYGSARSVFEESLAIHRELGDKLGMSALLRELGAAILEQGDDALAWLLVEESLTIARQAGDRRPISFALLVLGRLMSRRGDDASARLALEESLAIARELGYRWLTAYALIELGKVARAQADYASARLLYEESMRTRSTLGSSYDVAESLEAFAALRAVEGEPEQAARLWGAAEAWREAMAAPLPPSERSRYEHDVEAARACSDEARFMAAWAKGRALSLEQAVALALHEDEIAR